MTVRLRHAVFVITGILLAFLAGMILLSAGLVVEVFFRPAADSVSIVKALIVLLASLGPEAVPRWLAAGLHAAWVAALALCFAPVTAIALLGEAAGARALSWYAGATGVVTAAIPSIARGALGRSSDLTGQLPDGRLTLLFFLTGIATGSVYWAAAGGHARYNDERL